MVLSTKFLDSIILIQDKYGFIYIVSVVVFSKLGTTIIPLNGLVTDIKSVS